MNTQTEQPFVFTRVEDTTSDEQKEAIYDWCLDNVEHFGALPPDIVFYADEDDDNGEDITLSYDHMLSALTDAQLTHLRQRIEAHEQSHTEE